MHLILVGAMRLAPKGKLGLLQLRGLLMEVRSLIVDTHEVAGSMFDVKEYTFSQFFLHFLQWSLWTSFHQLMTINPVTPGFGRQFVNVHE